MNRYLLFLISIILVSCSQPDVMFKEPENKPKNILVNEIAFDTVKLEQVNNSTSVVTLCREGKILMVDKLFGWVYQYDTDGKLEQRFFGQGKSMQELPIGSIESCINTDDGGLLFLGSSNEWIKTDKLNNRINPENMVVSTGHTLNAENVYEREDIYAFMYEKFFIKQYKDNFYIPVVGDGEMFNIFTPDLGKEMRTIARIDGMNNQMNKFFGLITPQFDKTGGNAFPYHSFDIDPKNGNFYVTFETDSVIYVYDQNYELQDAFGYAGKNMNTSYDHIEMESYRDKYPQERVDKGYYDRIYVIDGKVFRTYKKGSHSEFDGLQVYQNGTLIADIETPKQFNIAGYIAPYYYSEIISQEDDGKQGLYRFMLGNEK